MKIEEEELDIEKAPYTSIASRPLSVNPESHEDNPRDAMIQMVASRKNPGQVDESEIDYPEPNTERLRFLSQAPLQSDAGSIILNGGNKPTRAAHDFMTPRIEEFGKELNRNFDKRSAMKMEIEKQKRQHKFQHEENELNRTAMSGRANKSQANSDRSYALREKALNDRNEQQANQAFSSQTQSYTNSLDAATRLRHVIQAVKSGELISSSNLAASMTNDMAQLLTNARSTTVSDREHAAVNSLEGKYNTLISYLESHPTDTVPLGYLDQFEKELNILEKSILQGYMRRTEELRRGTSNPIKQKVFENRFKSQSGNFNTDHLVNEPGMMSLKVQSPDGRVLMVPEKNVDEALKKGGTLINE